MAKKGDRRGGGALQRLITGGQIDWANRLFPAELVAVTFGLTDKVLARHLAALSGMRTAAVLAEDRTLPELRAVLAEQARDAVS